MASPLSYPTWIAQVRARVGEQRVTDEAPADTVWIDVREADEHGGGTIAGAHWIPRGELEARVSEVLPRADTSCVVFCSHGHRSLLAADTLGRMGYTAVRSLAGGTDAWVRAGRPLTAPGSALSARQLERYSRHLRIPDVGLEGQVKLLGSRVLMVGAGGLGSPVALYLAAAGVGTLGIIDDDVVDLSNLQRQVLHTEARVGQPKVRSARQTLEALNADVTVRTYEDRLVASNVLEVFADYDVVVDGGDNFATRYLVNDACVRLGIPLVSGSIGRFDGQVMVIRPHHGPCYRCLYPEAPPAGTVPSCQEAGVLGVVPGTVGLLQATEVVKLLLGIGTPLVGKLLLYDALETRFRTLNVKRRPTCATCGDDVDEISIVDGVAVCEG